MEIQIIPLSFVAFGAILTGIIIWKYIHSHIGIGCILRHKDGSVYIEARLLKGPAGRAEIPNGCKILSWNEFPMQFQTREEFFEAWERIRPQQVGESVSIWYEWQGQKHYACVTAERIYTTIPTYAPPLPYPQDDEWRIKRTLRECKKTGQWVMGHRLSETALDEILRPDDSRMFPRHRRK